MDTWPFPDEWPPNRCDKCGTDKLPPDTAFCGGCASDLDDEWMDQIERVRWIGDDA